MKHILQKAEKDHYACLLESYKSNMRKTWGVLKEIINKNKIRKNQAQFKLNDGSTTSDKLIISEKFNEFFFINIGPTLANKIPKQTRNHSFYLGLHLSIVAKKHSIATITKLRSSELLIKTPLLHILYYINGLTHDFWTRTGGWEFDHSHGAGTSSPSH